MPKRLPRSLVQAIDAAKIMGVRAGARGDHKYVGVWPVVVDGRAFARSWTLTAGGWYRTCLEDPLGTIQVGDREVRIRARRATGERLRDAVDAAYAAKFNTPASQKYVRGFKTRAAATPPSSSCRAHEA